jgi:biopolymer transport protein ExbD
MEEKKEKAAWPQEKPKRDRRGKKDAINVDMNPMVDLAFLLLTFFMLATTFSQPQVMELVMPVLPDKEDTEQGQAIKESQALSILLAGQDEIYWFVGITEPDVHQTSFDTKELNSILEEAHHNIDGLVVLIKPMDNCRYENLIDLLDEINNVGIERYAISDVTETDRSFIPVE